MIIWVLFVSISAIKLKLIMSLRFLLSQNKPQRKYQGWVFEKLPSLNETQSSVICHCVTNHNKESRNFQLGIPLFKRWNFSTVLIILPPTPFPTVPRVCAWVDLITTKPTNPGENFPLLIIGEQHHTWKFNGAKVITTDSVFCFHRRHTWTVTLARAKQYTWCRPSKINRIQMCNPIKIL